MILLFIGVQVDCITKTSDPLTLSFIWTISSPSLKVVTVVSVKEIPIYSLTLPASSRFALPVIS